MTIQDATETLRRGRIAAEMLMVDQCTAKRVAGQTETPDGVLIPTYSTVYSGKCKVQQTVSQSTNPDAGGHQFTVLDFAVHIPVNAPDLAIDDIVTIDSSANDTRLLNHSYRVVELFRKSFATAQRIRVKEVVA